MNYKQHPLSAAFPAMQDDEFQSLVDSIDSIGVQNPITLFEGMVLDGWHRYQAANQVNIDCPTVALGDVDPQDFVIAQNKARRNLTASQRAIAVTSVYGWHPVGKPSNCAPVHINNKTGQQLADIAGVSLRTINDSKSAQKAGFAEAVKAGAITVKEAAQIATGTVATPKPTPAIAPVVAKPVAVVEPETEAPPDYTELDAANDLVSELQSDLAVARMGNVTDEEKTQAASLIAELRADVKTLTATFNAVCLSRDSLMEENTQLKRQCQMQRNEINKLKANK